MASDLRARSAKLTCRPPPCTTTAGRSGADSAIWAGNKFMVVSCSFFAGKDARDPESEAWTFVQAGLLFWNEGDYDGADAVFAEALKWVPDYPPALSGRGK